MPDLKLAYGLNAAIPDGAHTAWGARLIWPNDLVFNRQDLRGEATGELKDWLNGGVLREVLDRLARLAHDDPTFTSGVNAPVRIYDDADGTVYANPNGSYGYVYVAAWLKAHVA